MGWLPLKSSRVSLTFSGGLSSISSARCVLGSLGNDWLPSYDSFLVLCVTKIGQFLLELRFHRNFQYV